MYVCMYVCVGIWRDWYGIAESEAAKLSDTMFIRTWKQRFKKVYASENGRYQLAHQMFQYKKVVDAVLNGTFANIKKWNTPRGLLAQVLLSDQFARGCGAEPLENQKVIHTYIHTYIHKRTSTANTSTSYCIYTSSYGWNGFL